MGVDKTKFDLQMGTLIAFVYLAQTLISNWLLLCILDPIIDFFESLIKEGNYLFD